MKPALPDTGLPADYYPTIVIGCGGTGLDALRAMLVYGTPANGSTLAFDPGLRNALESGRVRYIAIDTDRGDLFERKAVDKSAFPDALDRYFAVGAIPKDYPSFSNVVHIPRGKIESAIYRARRYSREHTGSPLQDEATSEALTGRVVQQFIAVPPDQYDVYLPPGKGAENGAGQFRALGRIGFLAGFDDFVSLFRRNYDLAASHAGGERVRVAIVGSLAGGTGSGMVIDVATTIRYILAPDAQISGWFMLPELYEPFDHAGRLRPNTFAALTELSVLSNATNERPVTIPYQIGPQQQNVVIRRGDNPIFDDVFLFDRSTTLLDWEPTPTDRARTTTFRGARSMMDTVLALSRRDVFGANPGRQNPTLGEAAGSVYSRRVFHGALASPLRPQPPKNLADILQAEILYHALIKPLAVQEQNIPLFVPERNRPAELERAQTFLERLVDDEVATPPALADLEKALPVVAKEFETEIAPYQQNADIKRLRQQFTEVDKPPQPGMEPERRPGQPDASRIYATLHNWFNQLFPPDGEEWPDLAKSESRQAAVQYPLHILAAPYFEALWEPVWTVIETLQEMAGKGRAVEPQHLERLRRFLSALEKIEEYATVRSWEVVVSPVVWRNRTLLAALFDLSEGARERTDKKWIGPLVSELRKLQAELRTNLHREWERVQSQDNGSEELAAYYAVRWARSTNLRYGQNESKLSEFRRTLAGTIKAFENNGRYYRRLRHAAFQDLYVSDESYQVARSSHSTFDHALAPFEDTALNIYRIDTERDTLDDADRKEFREHLDELQQFLGRAGQNLKDKFRENLSAQSIVESVIRERVYAVPNERVPLATAIAEPLANGAMAGMFKPYLTPNSDRSTDGSFGSRMKRLTGFCETFVALLTSKPEFHIARLGGAEKIEKTVQLCRELPFAKSGVLGSPPNTATYAPSPAAEASEKIRGTVEQIIARTLGRVPTVARASDAPLVLHESHFHGADEITNIESYAAAYYSYPDTQRGLFHVFGQALDFPKPQTEVLTDGAKAMPWNCHRHGAAAYKVAAAHTVCPRCTREYQVGIRPLLEISYRPDCHWFHPPTQDRSNRLDQDIAIAEGFRDYFFNGIPDHDVSDALETQLAAYGEPTIHDASAYSSRKPPAFRFPRIIDLDNGQLSWTVRSPDKDNRFIRADSTKDRALEECFHCHFPIDYDATGELPVTCPRCRRELEPCHHCTPTQFKLMTPQQEEGGQKRCPNCDNVMDIDHGV